jgi:hypothetical protein
MRKKYLAPSTSPAIVAEFGVAAEELVTTTFCVVGELKFEDVEYSTSYWVTAGVWPVKAVQDNDTLSVSES